MTADRKPPQRIIPPSHQLPAPAIEARPLPKMERRDVRVTIRFAESEAMRLSASARRRGDELSRYIRRAALMGDSVLQSMPA